MQWNRSKTIGLANVNCSVCHGVGLHTERNGHDTACKCVLREIFRACWNRFRECVALGVPSSVSFDITSGCTAHRSYSRKREEFAADFILVTKRTLNEEDYRLFRYFFLLGAIWKLCCKHLPMERQHFFHNLYRIEQRLGRVFAELEPYSLYPVDVYFAGRRHCEPVRACIPLVTEAEPKPELLIHWQKLVA